MVFCVVGGFPVVGWCSFSIVAEYDEGGVLMRFMVYLYIGLFLYVLFSYATSLSFKFLWNVRDGVDAINLAEFMPGDWVMACESHGYDQRFVVEEFGREYPLVGSADEDAWGMVFISGDGSYVSASGTCFDSGVILRATVKRCMKREEAVFKRNKRSARTGCAVFTTG